MKFFYDNFTEEQICGVFNQTHYAVIAVYFVLLAVALFFSVRLDRKKSDRLVLYITALLTVLEIVKIALRVIKRQNAGDWLPFYFSSLYLYAAWLSFSKREALRTTGCAFISFGSVVAGTVFIFYPSTSLTLFPLWHPGSIHSLLYHWLILYGGIVTLWKRYTPEPKHFLHYFVFVTIFSVLGAILNAALGTNMMFLGEPFKLFFLDDIFAFSPYLYMLIIYLAQGVLAFWVPYGIYRAVTHLTARKETELVKDRG